MPTNHDIQDNLSNWDDRANIHAGGGYGDIAGYINNSNGVTGTVKRDLEVLLPHLPANSVKGQRLLHLQSHIGTDTLSWWRLGAVHVHGIDFSPNSLHYARDIAKQAGADITYVQSDARYAAKALANEAQGFDVIVTSAGTITWLPDLQDWANSIAALLAPGGIFMIRDNHPLLFALDNDGLTITQNYFSGAEISYDSDGSYTAGSKGLIQHTRNHNWAHDFQEITSVLLKAGLTIEALGEQRITDWQALPMLTFNQEKDGWQMPADLPQIPLTFSLVARKQI